MPLQDDYSLAKELLRATAFVRKRVRIIGIDPGLRITGYGCIEAGDGGPVLIEAGVFRLGRALSARERDEVEFRVGDA